MSVTSGRIYVFLTVDPVVGKSPLTRNTAQPVPSLYPPKISPGTHSIDQPKLEGWRSRWTARRLFMPGFEPRQRIRSKTYYSLHHGGAGITTYVPKRPDVHGMEIQWNNEREVIFMYLRRLLKWMQHNNNWIRKQLSAPWSGMIYRSQFSSK